MLFQPKALSTQLLNDLVLEKDKKECKKYGPCGVGKRALYLGGFLLDRSSYIPLQAVDRAYKQVAISRGGLTGKGIFGSIPYLVVEYDSGKVHKSKFKWEEDIDRLLGRIHDLYPDIPLRSLAAQKKIDEEAAVMKSRLKKHISDKARKTVAKLDEASEYLEQYPGIYRELALASKAKRSNDLTNPFYKWVATAIFLMAIAVAVFGLFIMLTKRGNFGLYFLLMGLAFVMLFAGANVLPTKRTNAKAIQARLQRARKRMQECLDDYEDTFPLPARYCHPLALRRMKREVLEGRAETPEEALNIMKEDFKAVNSSVTVYMREYEEIVAVKPMFLIENYK